MLVGRESFYFGMKISRTAHRPLADEFAFARLALYRSDELAVRARIADKRLENCNLSGRYCHVNRKQMLEGEVCRIGKLAVVNSAGSHHWEEDSLRG